MIVIYQLLPRIFGNKNTTNKLWGTISENGCGKLNDINNKAIKAIKELGATHIWLTGIIQHASTTDYSQYNIPTDNPLIVKGLAGSPYAIKNYFDIVPDLAEEVSLRMVELRQLIDRIHRHGLKIIIDFVPNHVARNYYSDNNLKNINRNTKYDIGANDDNSQRFNVDNSYYYIRNETLKIPEEVYIQPHIQKLKSSNCLNDYHEYPARATGNDCFVSTPSINDWYETVKLNYGIDYDNKQCYFSLSDDTFVPKTWLSMLEVLTFWSHEGVDGFRCDMAEMVPVEFWHWAIGKLKQQFPNLIFICEIYQRERYADYLNEGKFDYLYDKIGLYDTLRNIITSDTHISNISATWQALDTIKLADGSKCYDKMLHFMENHDEQRIASKHFAQSAQAGIPAFALSAMMHKGPVMLYAGQELGVASDEASGFCGNDGRTTIFDYWAEDKIVRWNNNGKFNTTLLNNEERLLQNKYKEILHFINKEKVFANGDFYDMMWLNKHLYDLKCYAFARGIKRKEVIVVIINFNNNDINTKINFNKEIAEFFDLKTKTNIIEVEVENQNWHYLKIK